MTHISTEIQDKITTWLSDIFDENTKAEIQQLQSNPEELEDCFYKNLEFGTGGMRGVMGVGTNRINKYTLGKNTQGLANYLKLCYPNEALKVAIAYDCRHNSKTFAQVVANVFSANDIEVFLFEDLRPTPELSFTLKHLNCHCGIVLTASHNPPEYNGYKVYWNDGGQLVPPHDKAIIEVINSVHFSEINFAAKSSMIHYIGKTVDDAFIKTSVNNGVLKLNSPKNRTDLKIVFTSLHGTSITAIPDTLKRAGYTNVHIVKGTSRTEWRFSYGQISKPRRTRSTRNGPYISRKYWR